MGSVREMRIYNVKGISILKSLISQFNVKKLGFFHCSIKAPDYGIQIGKHQAPDFLLG